jgi:hypothetical protein
MLGYLGLLEASGNFKEEDLAVEKEVLVENFLDNPLGQLFSLLSNFLIASSAEAIDLAKSKNRPSSPQRTRSPKKKAKISKEKDNEIESIDIHPHAPQSPHLSHDSIPPSTPTNKRMFSGGSFSTSSTETTPVKISHPEAHTQALQNCLVETLMYRLWLGGAKIKWAEGRSMYLDYRPYIPILDFSNGRTMSTSFRCRLDGNTGNAFDRIVAVSDGALVLVTNKKSTPNSRLLWSLQTCALAFEVHSLLRSSKM